MSRAQEIAAAAAKDERDRTEALRDEAKRHEQQARSERVRYTLARGYGLLASPSWFPGVIWEVWDVDPNIEVAIGSFYCVVVKELTGDLFLIIDGSPYNVVPHVYVGVQINYNGYVHWTGDRVRSAADVGRWLASH